MAIIDPHTTETELYSSTGGASILGDKARENGLRFLILGASHVKERLSGVIHPSYDFTLDTSDTAFGASVGPCWKNIPDKELPKHFLPAGWAVPLFFYTFVGEPNAHFISPVNKRKMLCRDNLNEGDDADAFNDLWWYIKKHRTFSENDKKYYLDKPDKRTASRVPNRQTKFCSFATTVTKDDDERRVNMLAYTPSCHGFMLDQMRWINEDQSQAIDPKWARYLLGDPTRRDAAMVWEVDKRQLDPKDAQETNCIVWTKKRELLDSPVLTQPISDEELAKRFIMIDDSQWNFPTYQEMVDFMVEHLREIPLELIKAACGSRANVGERAAVPQHASPTGGGGGDHAPTGGGESQSKMGAVFDGLGEPAPTAAPANTPAATVPATVPAETVPAATVPTTVPAEVLYTAGTPGAPVEQLTLAQLTAKAATPGLMVFHNGAWAGVYATGLVAAPVAAATVPTTVPETVPAATVPETVPAAVNTVAAATVTSAVDPAAIRRSVCSDSRYEAMSAENKAAVDTLVAEVVAARASGLPMPPPLMDRMLKIADPAFGA